MRDRSFVDEILQWRKNRVYVSEEIFFFMHASSDKGGQKLHASFQQYKHCLVVVLTFSRLGRTILDRNLNTMVLVACSRSFASAFYLLRLRPSSFLLIF